MAISNSGLRSKLARAKGMGAAHHGVGHWWMQRVTAVAMLVLMPWAIYQLMTAISLGLDAARLWFASGVNATLFVLLLVAMFYHGKLGFQVVVEDYVKQPVFKYGLLLANSFFAFGLGALCVLAVVKLHFGL
jgi:succinate dehydrogenase / fumarate reductase membrane anchor subunit